ncbi:MAG: 50S ribosomal protein L3 [Candidatus Pacearchaeota archaeon]
MPRLHRPKYGSLQFWPRKRSEELIPDVNWEAIKTEEKGPLGFLAYKVGMMSAIVKDDTPDSMTKGKKIAIPVTILECPEMKIFSIRFYKDRKVVGEIVVSNDKNLKRKIKLPKKVSSSIDSFNKEFNDIRIIAYPNLGKNYFKKTPDLVELALGGTKEEKLAFVKEKIGKTIKISEIFQGKLVDVRGVTKGKGLQGPAKRFGISLRQHKSEKGVRRPGSLGPWHPARVMFVTPMAGQTGFNTRVIYNLLIVDKGNIKEKDITPKSGFHKYGKLKGDYLIVSGSVQGTPKRVLLLTKPLRPTKKQLKKQYSLVELT